MKGRSDLINAQAVAAAGSTRTDAAEITMPAPAIIHGTGANGTKGIKLPGAVKGKMYFVKNSDAAAAVLKVWPNSSDEQINAVTAGSSLDMAAGTAAVFVAFDDTHWYTFSLLPS